MLQNLTLANRVCNLLLCDDLLLREDLHSIDAPRVLLSHLEDPAERPTPDKLEEFKVAGN